MARRLIPIFLLAATLARAADTDAYLFTYFTGNGEDGLHLAWSRDGANWSALNQGRSVLAPAVGSKEKLIRDPCVALGPDGLFHVVWTCGWWDRGIGYASSRDLVHWSDERLIPVMASEPTARNCWAPEIVWDPAHSDYLIHWATTIPGRFPGTDGSSESGLNHRIYFTTTRDFQAYAPTRLLYDPGFSEIDATFLDAGGRLYLIIKDETVNPPRKHLRMAAADSYEGPFHELSAPISPAGVWAEGPTAIMEGDSAVVYFDCYKLRRYGAVRSRDLRNWEDVSAQLHVPGEGTPQRMRHGTAIRVPYSVIATLLSR
jgi:beta-xylosidase